MKRIISLYSSILFLAILSTQTAFSQTPIVITLEVNTAEITKNNKDVTCTFMKKPDNVTNEDFTIEAKVGDIIVWKGVSSSNPEGDRVDITAINHEGGKNVFGKNKLNGNGQQPETVIGTVVQGAPGDVDKYKISFKVFNAGTKRNGTFHIDPKIQIIN